MNILIVHNFYNFSGGEDIVVTNEFNALKKTNNNIYTYYRNSSEINSLFRLLFSFLFSIKTFIEIRKIILKNNIDLIHLHNIFPLISPSIYFLIKLYKLKTVQSVHNYKFFCLNGLFLRNGMICTKCLSKLPFYGILYKCYKNSYFFSFAYFCLSFLFLFKPNKLPVDKFLVFNNYVKNIFIKSGVDESKLELKNNFIPQNKIVNFTKIAPGEDFLYVGRLSIEKGIFFLLDCFNNHKNKHNLNIIGDTSSVKNLNQYISKNINFLGAMNNHKVYKFMQKSRALILPSICLEGLPMVVIESLSQGLPVIMPDHDPLLEMFSGLNACYFYKSNNINDLIKVLNQCISDSNLYTKKSKNAILAFKRHYSEKVNINSLIRIYNSI